MDERVGIYKLLFSHYLCEKFLEASLALRMERVREFRAELVVQVSLRRIFEFCSFETCLG